jgi:hypothetical protein
MRYERILNGNEVIMGKVMRKNNQFDGYARLSASVLQHAFINISKLCEERRQSNKKNDIKSLSKEIEIARAFLVDPRNIYVNYLELSGHVLDLDKINSIIDSFEEGEECPKLLSSLEQPKTAKGREE